MLVYTLLLSSAAALEIGLNMTGSGTAQFQLTSSTSSTPQTVTEILETVSGKSSPGSTARSTSVTSSPTTSGSAIASPSVTDGPIYTSAPCLGDGYGQNCNRSPEYPYWYSISPGNFIGGFTPTGMENPWAYYTSFLDFNLTSGALESATSCAAIFYSSLDDWLATAPLTTSGVLSISTVTSTLVSISAVETKETVTGTGNVVNTYTETISGVLTTGTDTATSAFLYSTYVTTVIQQATTETIIYSPVTPYFYKSYYTPTFASPCCSSCTIYGGNIEVMYFPPATATAVANKTATSPSTVVDSAGFTFTSPSIYMAIQTLAASNLCGQVGSSITLATTLSFAKDALSTVPAYSSAGSLYTFSPFWEPSAFTPATFGTASCTDVVTSTNVNDLPPVEVTYNPCYPYISIPPQVRSADPLWSTCVSQWSIVLYDPPYVISSAQGGLDPFTSTSTTPTADPITSPAPVASTTEPASPGSATEPIASPTLTSTLIPTTPPTDPTSTDPSADPSPSTSPSVIDPADPSPSTSPSVVDPANPSPSTSPSVVDPANPSPSTSPIVLDPGTSSSSAGGVVANPSNPKTSPPAVVTIGSSTITADSSSNFVIGTQTLTPGGQITVSGTPVSLAPNGATIVAGGSTQAIATPTAAPTLLIGSQTLSAGGAPITVSGTVFSLQPGGSSVIVGGSTQAIGAFLSTPEYVVASGSQTLVAGGPEITVSGTVVSLQTEGSSVVIGGTTTEALSAYLGSSTTTASGLGGVIVSVGGFGTSTSGSSGSSSTGLSTYNGTVFTGSAVKRGVENVWIWGITLVASIPVVAWL